MKKSKFPFIMLMLGVFFCQAQSKALFFGGYRNIVTSKAKVNLEAPFTIEATVAPQQQPVYNNFRHSTVISMRSDYPGNDTIVSTGLLLEIDMVTGKPILTMGYDYTVNGVNQEEYFICSNCPDMRTTGNQFTHVAASRNGQTVKIYVNGVLQQTFTATLTLSFDAARSLPGYLNFGAEYLRGYWNEESGFIPSSNTLKGYIHNVRTWNVARTDAEILSTYNQCLVGDEPSLTNYFKMNEGKGQSIANCAVVSKDFPATVGLTTDEESTLPNAYDATWTSVTTMLDCPLCLLPSKTRLESLSFDGTNDFVAIPPPAAISTMGESDFTIEARIKASSTQSMSYPAIYSNRSSSNGLLLFLVPGPETYAQGKPWVNIQNINYPCSDCPSLTDNQPHMLSVKRTGGNIKFFVDGQGYVSRPLTVGSSSVSSTANINLGNDVANAGSCYFKGEISETRVWNVARSDADILTYASKTVSRNATGLVGNWRLNDHSQTVYDNSSNNAHGTLGATSGVDASDPAWITTSTVAPPQIGGAAFENPLIIGTLVQGQSFRDNKSNVTSNNFGDDLGRSTDDIFYKFTITQTSLVTISQCNSAIYDSYLWLYKADRSLLDYNDDNGPICAIYRNSSLRKNLLAGTYYIVVEGYDGYTGNIETTVSVAPFNSSYGTAAGRLALDEQASVMVSKSMDIDNESQQEAHAYPNPIRSGTLHFGRHVNHFTLMNSAGHEILKGEGKEQVEISGLPAGIYLLMTDTKTEKIVIKKE